MSRHRNTLDQIQRLNGGLEWKLVEALLKHLGADVLEGAGSSLTFRLHGQKLTIHLPHPRRECGRGLVKRVKVFLQEVGEL